MKTTIDLSNFSFQTQKGKPARIFTQISDCPVNGFPRVLVYKGDNFQEDLEMWIINAEIYYLNPINNKIIKKEIARSKNQDWIIGNNYLVTLFNAQMLPVANPNFKIEDEEGNPLEISESNLPYLTQGAFDRFSGFRIGDYSLTNKQLFLMSVESDDSHGYFDDKENHKTLVQVQTELYNLLNP